MYFLLAQTVLLFDFLPDERVLPVLYLSEIPTLTPHVQMLCVRYDYANYSLKVNNMEDF